MPFSKGTELVHIFTHRQTIYLSNEYEELLGFTLDEIKSMSSKGDPKLYPPKEFKKLEKTLFSAIQQGLTSVQINIILLTKGGLQVFGKGYLEFNYSSTGKFQSVICRLVYNHINDRVYNTRKLLEERLESRNKIVETLSNVTTEILVNEDTTAVLANTMREVGKVLNVDRIHYFKWNEKKQEAAQVVEWTYEGTEPQLNNPDLQHVPLKEFEDLDELFSSKKSLISFISDLKNKDLKSMLEAQDIKSMAIIPVFRDNILYGTLGVDDCQLERKWSDFEIQSLTSLANVFANGLERKNYQKAIEIKKNELATILNSIDDIVFTANWRTLEFEFKNSNFLEYSKNHLGENETLVSSMVRLIEPEDQNKIKRFNRKVYNEGFAKARFKTIFKGEFKWVDYYSKVVKHPSFDKPFILGVIRDISKEQEAKLKAINAIETKQLAEKKIAELEVRTLQMQMNPHFIFNALNSIQSFIINNDPLAANEYLSNFSNLMRLLLDSSRNKYVSIESELKLIKLYIQVEKSRFPKTFDYEIVIDPSLNLNTEIPTMIIQPFIENAINHGLRNKAEKGFLSIQLLEKENSLIALVQDDGIGLEKSLELQKKMKHGYKSQALQITEERIQIYNTNNQGKMSYLMEPLYPELKEPGLRVTVSFPMIVDKNKI